MNAIFDKTCANLNDQFYNHHGQHFAMHDRQSQQNRKSLHSIYKLPVKLRKSSKDLYPTLQQISQICQELMGSISKIQAISDQEKRLSSPKQNQLQAYLQTSQVTKQKPIKVIYPVPCDYIRSLMLVNRNEIKHRITSKIITLIPNLHFQMKQIQPIKIVANPLSKFLTQKKVLATDFKRQNRFDTGFLTLDEEHRLLPLMQNEQLTLKYPIVGVWVYNVPEVNFNLNEDNQSQKLQKSTSFEDIISHPLVWSACSRFIFCDQFQSKLSLSESQNSFLLVCFHGPTNNLQNTSSIKSNKNLSPIFMEFKALNSSSSSSSSKNSSRSNKWMVVQHDQQSLRQVNGFQGFNAQLNSHYSYSLQQYLELLKQKRKNVMNITCNNNSEDEEEAQILDEEEQDLIQFQSVQRSNSHQQSRRMSLNQQQQQQREPGLKLVRMQSQKTLRSSSSSVLSGSLAANNKQQSQHSSRNFYKQNHQLPMHNTEHQHSKQPPYSGGTSQMQINLSNYKQQHTGGTSSAFPPLPSHPRSFSPLQSGSFDATNQMSNNNQHYMMLRNSGQSNIPPQAPHWGYSPSNPVVNISSTSSMIPYCLPPNHHHHHHPSSPPFYNQQQQQQQQYQADMDAMKVVSQQAASIKALQTQLSQMQKLFMQSAMWQPNGNACFQSIQQQMMMNQFNSQQQLLMKKEMKDAETQTTIDFVRERQFTNMQNSFCQSLANTYCLQSNNNIGQVSLPQNPLQISEIKSTHLTNEDERAVTKDQGNNNILTQNVKKINIQNFELKQTNPNFEQSNWKRSILIPSPQKENQVTQKFQRKLSVQELASQSSKKNINDAADFKYHSPTKLLQSFSSKLKKPSIKKALSESGSKKEYLQRLQFRQMSNNHASNIFGNDEEDDDDEDDDDDQELYKSMLKVPKIEQQKKILFPPSLAEGREQNQAVKRNQPLIFQMNNEENKDGDDKQNSVSLSLKKEIKFPDKSSKQQKNSQFNVSQFTMDMPIIIYKEQMDDSDQDEVSNLISQYQVQDDSCSHSQLKLIN